MLTATPVAKSLRVALTGQADSATSPRAEHRNSM
jgi:hypothetical protein